MESASQFPRFRDGDVYIAISAGRSYKLHSNTLGRLSTYFKEQLAAYPGAKLTAAAKRDGAAAYYFELNTYLPEQFGKFMRIRVSDGGKPQRDHAFFPGVDVSFDQDPEREGRIWDWLFGSFYNLAPKFEDHNLATVLHSCLGLVDAADSIGSIDHVCEIVDLALLRQDQVLWKSVAANPTAWTELGYRVHSQSIFKEGMIHLIGVWPRMSEDDRRELRPEIRTLCERKHTEIDMAKGVIELRILGHYPAFMSRSHIDKPQRTSYSSDIYMWMCVGFYRQFFAQAISHRHTRQALDGGWKFYNAVHKGGNAYLSHEDFQAFYQHFPMSSKACNVLEANMNVLKDDIKAFVNDIVISRVHIKPEDYPVEWLTCAVIEKSDFPWEVDDTVPETQTQSHQTSTTPARAEMPDMDVVDSNIS